MARNPKTAAEGLSAAEARALLAQEQAEPGRRKRKRGPWFVVFIVALVVFVASVAALGVIAFSYLQGQQKYGEVAEKADFDPVDLDAEEGLSTVNVDWDALLAVNPDTVGWVYVPNTVINYPIVQGSDNDHYLVYDFDGDAGWLAEYGAVFLDYRNSPDFSDQVSFVYGHHMNDGSMFAPLAGMADQARFDECRTAYLLTPQGNFRLRTFALLHVPASEGIVQTTFEDRRSFTDYVQDKMDRSVVAVNDAPAATQMKKVFAFATCDEYSSGRYVLMAYPVDTTAEGLSGDIGLVQDDEGNAQGWANDVETEPADQQGQAG